MSFDSILYSLNSYLYSLHRCNSEKLKILYMLLNYWQMFKYIRAADDIFNITRNLPYWLWDHIQLLYNQEIKIWSIKDNWNETKMFGCQMEWNDYSVNLLEHTAHSETHGAIALLNSALLSTFAFLQIVITSIMAFHIRINWFF